MQLPRLSATAADAGAVAAALDSLCWGAIAAVGDVSFDSHNDGETPLGAVFPDREFDRGWATVRSD